MAADTTTILKTHRPPYDLTADYLFVGALAATAPLRRSFPGVPFLSIFGKTPLILWFSRITEACYYDADRHRQCERETDQVPYTELNVIATLRKKALFVPKIYASRELTVQISTLYAMPKSLGSLTWHESDSYVASSLVEAGRESVVQARLLKGGGIAARWLSSRLPVTVWPAQFPAGSSVRAIIQHAPSLRPAWIKKGQLALPEPWLPEPVSFFPIGFYLPRLAMTLPPPL